MGKRPLCRGVHACRPVSLNAAGPRGADGILAPAARRRLRLAAPGA